MTHTIYDTLTKDFVEQVKVSAVYVECDGEYLYMRKTMPDTVKGKWGVPGGKVEEGEDITAAAVRELKEEAGIEVCEHALKYLKPLYIKTSYASFGFYIFVLTLKEKPEVTLSDEHDEYGWYTSDKVKALPHMSGGIDPFQHVERYLRAKKSPKTIVSSYLLLLKDGKVCLGQRKNTSYMDGYYGLISGHVEEGEAASTAMIREAREEGGIDIDPKDLECAHIMHRGSKDRLNIDVFFACSNYAGELVNKEPDKCGGWEFFEMDSLPEKTMDYVKQAIESYREGKTYSEWGFTTVMN